MNEITKVSKNIILDHLGQYYASTHSAENPSTFSITIHLKETVEPVVLQSAVNKLLLRYPHLNVKLKNGFFWYFHKRLNTPIEIINQDNLASPPSSFAKNETLTRILYGKQHFTIEVLHTVCDGRSLAKITSVLLEMYFELLGGHIENPTVMNNVPIIEEIEDAYKRYADLRKPKYMKEEAVYMPQYKKTTPKVITKHFNLEDIKNKAQTKGATITEYIMTHIINEFLKNTENTSNEKPIAVNVPIDCRSFFTSKSLRNFVTSKTIIVSNGLNYDRISQEVKTQLMTINSDYVQEKISEMERLIKISNYIPLFIKKWLIKKIGHQQSKGNTTGFSNLGFFKLPEKMQRRIYSISFVLGAEPNMPYQFGCVATGDILTFTATTTAHDNGIIDNIFAALLQ